MSGEETMAPNYTGQPKSRVDGRAKVTGEAKYAAEYNVPNLTYGYVVSSELVRSALQVRHPQIHLQNRATRLLHAP